MDPTMFLPPPAKLSGCLAALECAAIRLWLLGYAEDRYGMVPANAAVVATLADAEHKLPYLIQRWESGEEGFLRVMLDDFDKRFPHASSLLGGYDGA